MTADADRNEISRRSFTATTTLTAAAVVAGGAREQVVGDARANALLTRPYRTPFVIPDQV